MAKTGSQKVSILATDELYKTLLRKAMALCAGREMCIFDLSHRLASWGANENQSEKIIQKLSSEKFIDQERYAIAFTRDKFTYNKWGKIKIAHGLKLKKIPSEIINRALNTIDDDTYMTSLKNVMAAHRKTVKAKNQYDLMGKMLRYGLSRGFESNLLYEFLNDPETP
jgi:regulatory protein